MFQENDQHRQTFMFSSINSLPKKLLRRLEASWAGTFYRKIFVRIDEKLFAILFSDEASRPNTPVNVLVGLIILKAGFGWSDEEMYDHFCYDIQVRYALGYRDLGKGYFELRTLYNFRRRVTQYMQETGENLIEQVFEQITYVYHLKGEHVTEHLQRIGALMGCLVDGLASNYSEEPAYRALQRVFQEHFTVDDAGLRPKEGKELSASSLQSPDDWEATYRQKRGEGYQGYVVNVTETCNPENELQLIVKVQTEANNTDDAAMLDEALPDLKERTAVDQMNTDGGYNSPDVDKRMHELGVEQVQSAIRGRKPSEEKLGREDFGWELDADGNPQTVTCPNGQQAEVTAGRKEDRCRAAFDAVGCESCSFYEACLTQLLKRAPQRVLWFSHQDVELALRRQRTADMRASGQNLRAAVEATVRSIKHPFGNGKVPVRGQDRDSMVMLGSAAMSNVRRIHRYLVGLEEAKGAETEGKEARQGQQTSGSSLFASFLAQLRRFLRLMRPPQPIPAHGAQVFSVES